MAWLSRFLSVVLLLSVCLLARAVEPDAQIAWRLLDYIAVDYAEAVEDGVVVDEDEYAEMVEFSAAAHERLESLPPVEGLPEMLVKAKELQGAIDGKREPDEVGVLARQLAAELLAAYPMPVAPGAAPDLARGGELYQQVCASCHGTAGGGDGPAAADLDPPAIDFTDRARARERSVFALYQVIEQGLEGTSMASYAGLPEDDRWALSFYIGQYAYPESLAARGEQLWNDNPALQAEFPDLAALTQVTPAALAAHVGEEDAQALTAFLRRQPEAVEAGPAAEGLLALSRARLVESLAAYEAGDQRAARDLALSAYLDGFEPVEPLLAIRDRALMTRIEGAMGELRAGIERSIPAEQVRARVEAVDAMFVEAEAALAPEMASRVSAFVGAFTILLREGLEALLIVIAMIAFLRKAGRIEALPYVHAGWVGALLAGGATWAAATWLVSISGASRELTEGFAAIFAAVVLVWVGIWMHGKSQAGAWQRYISDKLSKALSRRSMWFLFLLSFIVVYREAFETVLFYAALWSQGAHAWVAIGAAAAVVVLALIAWVMLRYSRRLPFGAFFAVSSALLAVLAVVLTGKGVSALQEAGWLSITPVQFPRIDLLGIYPTTQGLCAQALAIALLAAGFLWNRHKATRDAAAAA